MKSMHVLVVVVILVVLSSIVWISLQPSDISNQNNTSCYYGELNYYYRDGCYYCQQVSNDKTLEKLQELGVQVNKFNVVEWGMYDIYATPTFEIGGQRIRGYQTFEQLKGLLGC